MSFMGKESARGRFSLRIDAAVLLALLLSTVAVTNPPSTRVMPADLTYRGAFLLPDEFNWGARGVTYFPLGYGGAGTLLILGPDPDVSTYGEVNIPTPVITSNWAALPVATLLTPLRDFAGIIMTLISPESPDTLFASGIEYVPRCGSQATAKLYGSVDQWYGVVDESHPTIWFSEMNGSNPRGPWHVGPEVDPFHGNKAGDYLFSVPQWYANQYLSGRTLFTGKTRGAFHGSMGPTFLAFPPWTVENPTGNLNALALVYYRLNWLCAAPNVSNKTLCDYPNFTMCDKWEGGAFLNTGSKMAIILSGVKGLGGNSYGPPPSPYSCEQDQGYHCDPYERQIIFYDVWHIALAAMGRMQPWAVAPYAIWRPTQFFMRNSLGYTCGQSGGVALDTAGKRLFIIEKGLGGDENRAAVHVWSLP